MQERAKFWRKKKVPVGVDERAPQLAKPSAANEDYLPATPTSLGIWGQNREANLGLKLIYEPSNPKSPVVDIVFIHGLTGSSQTTWLHENGVHWPMELLPKDIPDSRILCFGYDADVAHFWAPASSNTIANHAENLLGSLSRLRVSTDTEDRSIIFVAHSLGGLVIKNALWLADYSAEKHIRDIGTCTVGIAFLGTPHHGSDLAAWAVLGSRMCKIIKQSNTKILQVLEPDSEVLASIQNGFYNGLRIRNDQNFGITCFYEELPMQQVGEVVPRHSAIISGRSSYGIHANHSNMTRFPSSNNAGYLAVSGEIFRWVKPVRQRIERAIEDCFQTFNIEELQSQRRIFNQRVFSTNDWLWSGATMFSNWLRDGKGLLWISGKPGSGKSTVMNHIARNLESKQDQCDHNIGAYRPCRTIVGTYFFDFSSSERARSAAAAFNRLIYQLLTNEPSLKKLVLPVYTSMRGMRTDFTWDLEYLRLCLGAIFRGSRDFKFLLLIDALDESSMEPFDLAELLILLANEFPDKLQLCVSSRPNVDFIDPFGQCPRITLEDETGSDIMQYVQSEFRRAIGRDNPDIDELCQAIVYGSEGVFLWVKLVTAILLRARRRGEDFDQLKRRLNDFPNDLNAFYQRMLDDLDPDDQEEIRIMLAIVTSAVEPLTPLDLRYAVHFCHTIYSDLNNEDLAARRIMAVCSGLLEIRYSGPNSSFPGHENHLASKSDGNIEDTARVHLAHETVKSFLYLKPDILRWTAADNAPVSGNILLLEACIMMLRNFAEHFRKDLKSEFSQISDWPKRVVPFLAYSVKWWPLHAQRSEHEMGQAPLVLRNFSPFEYNLWRYLFDQTSWMLRYEEKEETSESNKEVRALRMLYEQIPSTLEEFAVSLNLPLLARYLLDYKRVEDRGSLLFAVAKSGNLEIARSLISQPLETIRDSKLGQYALCRAIYFGHLEIARLLLKHGANPDISAVYWRDMTGAPLQVAVRMGNSQAIELLSEFGVNIDARDANGSAAITTAAQQGDHNLVKLLIRCGATLNAPIPNEKCDNALAAAIRSPTLSSSMITSLLEGGADPNLIQPHGKVPVIWNAVESCDIQAVRSLLGCGAKLNFVDERGHTLLHKAVELFRDLGSDRFKHIGQLLVEHGATFNDSDRSDLGLPAWSQPQKRPFPYFTQNSPSISTTTPSEEMTDLLAQAFQQRAKGRSPYREEHLWDSIRFRHSPSPVPRATRLGQKCRRRC